MAMVVVLPAPLPPSRPTVEPFGTTKLTSSTAHCVPYFLHRFSHGDGGRALQSPPSVAAASRSAPDRRCVESAVAGAELSQCMFMTNPPITRPW